MDKISSFLKKMESSILYQLFFFFVCMFILGVIYNISVGILQHRLFKVTNDDYSWVYQVDSIEEENDKITIRGWAFNLNKNAEPECFNILLYDSETEKCIYPKMHYEARNDVNDYFLCEYDYTQCGFSAVINKDEMEKQCYEILLRPVGEQKAISTNIFSVNGKIAYVNPEEFKELNTEGTDLEEITHNGVVRVYRPDYGMYVYQYGGELYWIAEPYYDFENGGPTIQYQMNTTQIEKLPEERLVNEWLWSNLNFSFFENELLDWNTGEYRVAKQKLPLEYSITYIWTGCHTDDWIWRANFRPVYEFY